MRRDGFVITAALALSAVACGGGEAPEGTGGAGQAGAPVQVPVEPVEARPLEGMMTYMADAALFTECRTGIAYPIAMEGDYRALEEAYLRDRTGPGEPLLVRVRGSLASREGMEGGSRISLVVEAFEGTGPGAGCGEATADLPLEGTSWVLLELAGAPLPEGVEATLLLDGGEGRASGSGGCNAFGGPYRLEGGRLTFGNMEATQRSCVGAAMEVEIAFFRTLARVGGYRLLGGGLELLAEEGVVARFRVR